MAPKGPFKDPVASFEEKVDRTPGHGPEGDCHVWTRALNHGGYGHGYFAGKVYRTHRIAWFLEHGEWPALCVLHTCDNRRCVNPAHLFLGTRLDNNRDMAAKGRARGARGEASPHARLNALQAGQIRALRGVETPAETARRFGVTAGHVTNIQAGRKWAHL